MDLATQQNIGQKSKKAARDSQTGLPQLQNRSVPARYTTDMECHMLLVFLAKPFDEDPKDGRSFPDVLDISEVDMPRDSSHDAHRAEGNIQRKQTDFQVISRPWAETSLRVQTYNAKALPSSSPVHHDPLSRWQFEPAVEGPYQSIADAAFHSASKTSPSTPAASRLSAECGCSTPGDRAD